MYSTHVYQCVYPCIHTYMCIYTYTCVYQVYTYVYTSRLLEKTLALTCGQKLNHVYKNLFVWLKFYTCWSQCFFKMSEVYTREYTSCTQTHFPSRITHTAPLLTHAYISITWNGRKALPGATSSRSYSHGVSALDLDSDNHHRAVVWFAWPAECLVSASCLLRPEHVAASVTHE